MKPYFELHVTFLADGPEPPSCLPRGWKYSRIDGDPTLGDGVKSYLTRQLPERWGIDYCKDKLGQAMAHLRDLGYRVLRLKVELVLHDSRPRG